MVNSREAQDVQVHAGQKDEKIQVLIGKIVNNWYWFFFGATLGLFIAFLFLRYSTPIYKVNARVLVNDEKKGGGLGGQSELLGDLGGLLGAKSTVDNEVEILKTRMLMEQVVNELSSNVTYFKKGVIRDVELMEAPIQLTLLDARDSIREAVYTISEISDKTFFIQGEGLDTKVALGKVFHLPKVGRVFVSRNRNVTEHEGSYLVEVVNVERKVADYRSLLNVGVTNKLVSIMDLTFDYPEREKGELILKTLIAKYVESNIQDKNTIADSTINFIENRLVFVGTELGDIESNIQGFKERRKLADISEQAKLLIENSSQYIKELAEVETQLSIFNSMESYLAANSSEERILPSAIIPSDLVFSGLIERYNTLLLERDRLSLTSTDNNPTILNINQQITNLRKDLLSNLRSTKQNLIITRNDLRRKTGQFEGDIRAIPAAERTYLDLARQQQIKQELYVFLLQKREETAISKTSNIANSRVIEPPVADTLPFSPRKKLAYVLGLLAGLGIPFIALSMKEAFNTKILTKNDIVLRTSIPIIGEISHSLVEQTIVVSRDSRSPIAEQFRALRTNLSFFLKTPDKKTILLTSSMSGEGKSFVSLNMAIVMALSGKKVVLMEMDLRRPNITNKLNLVNNIGFTNFIINSELRAQDIYVPTTTHENLFLISSGPVPPNPTEVILDKRMEELMTALEKEFDYIIIDAPPIGLVTDAQLISKYADLTIYVLRQGFTFKNQIEIANELYTNKKMGDMSLIINDIELKGGYGYSYGYGYGYGYGTYS